MPRCRAAGDLFLSPPTRAGAGGFKVRPLPPDAAREVLALDSGKLAARAARNLRRAEPLVRDRRPDKDKDSEHSDAEEEVRLGGSAVRVCGKVVCMWVGGWGACAFRRLLNACVLPSPQWRGRARQARGCGHAWARAEGNSARQAARPRQASPRSIFACLAAWPTGEQPRGGAPSTAALSHGCAAQLSRPPLP